MVLILVSTILWLSQLVRSAATQKSFMCPDGKNIANNLACCVLFPVLEDLQDNLFEGNSTCTEEAREIIQLSFHDAMGFSRKGGFGGGADGSILTFGVETTFEANSVVEDTIAFFLPFVNRHSNVSAGDILHFSAAVGLSTCPGAPRLPFLIGRPPAKVPAANTTVPQPIDSVTSILARFQDVGFSPQQVVALLSAHSIATRYSTLDPALEGVPLDSTPKVFDTQIFLEVLLKGTVAPVQAGEAASPIPGEVRLVSDFLIARDPRTACFWEALIGDQTKMVDQFQAAMQQLSVVGQDTSKMIDCSDVIPLPKPVTSKPHFPAGHGISDAEQSCTTARIPTNIPADTGPATSLSPEQCPFCWRDIATRTQFQAPPTQSPIQSTSTIE